MRRNTAAGIAALRASRRYPAGMLAPRLLRGLLLPPARKLDLLSMVSVCMIICEGVPSQAVFFMPKK